MNVFGVGPTEIFVVLIVILVLFGPEKLPELAKKIGGASREIRENLNAVNEQMNDALETSMELDKARMTKPVPAISPATESILPPPKGAAESGVTPPVDDIPPPPDDTLAR
jgi:sec-independent protein translocase protein TatA